MHSAVRVWFKSVWRRLAGRLKHRRAKHQRPLSRQSDMRSPSRASDSTSLHTNSRPVSQMYRMAEANDSGTVISIVTNGQGTARKARPKKPRPMSSIALSSPSPSFASTTTTAATTASAVLPSPTQLQSESTTISKSSSLSRMLAKVHGKDSTQQHVSSNRTSWLQQQDQQRQQQQQQHKRRSEKKQLRRLQHIDHPANLDYSSQYLQLKRRKELNNTSSGFGKSDTFQLDRSLIAEHAIATPPPSLCAVNAKPPHVVVLADDRLIRKVSMRPASLESLQPVQASALFSNFYGLDGNVSTNYSRVGSDDTVCSDKDEGLGAVPPSSDKAAKPYKANRLPTTAATSAKHMHHHATHAPATSPANNAAVSLARKLTAKLVRPFRSPGSPPIWPIAKAKRQPGKFVSAAKSPLPPAFMASVDPVETSEFSDRPEVPPKISTDSLTKPALSVLSRSSSRTRSSLQDLYEDVMLGDMSLRAIAFKWMNASQKNLSSNANTPLTHTADDDSPGTTLVPSPIRYSSSADSLGSENFSFQNSRSSIDTIGGDMTRGRCSMEHASAIPKSLIQLAISPVV
ncbi:hypothetical protein BASA61_003558 [Batrachochytrium salamandrivorans]|nr:hypothetical protein BASA62_006989 [Batrachochytrium salamandrivorans]KAH6596151.1 hypothetical protein BASA61_003558 [Batrachochytrium salamandrivorans]KAH9254332.1 hypothetical protein BASA81_007723 [Batrachochytrium salamandrivorans]